MKLRKMMLLVIGLALVGGMAFGAWAGNTEEEEVTLDQVPAAVKATILNEAAGAEIKEIERETKGDTTTYDAEFLVNGVEVEVRIAADGTLLGREIEEEDDDDEETVTIDQIPEAARAALLTLAGSAEIVEAGREKEDGVLIYEAAWVTKGTKHEAAVTADGTLIETEEVIPAENAPAAVRAAIAAHFGAGAKVVVEKKMVVMYEVEGKIDGHEEELLVLPTGRVVEEPDDDEHDNDADEDNDGDDDD